MGRVIARSEATKQSSTALRTGLLRFARNAKKQEARDFSWAFGFHVSVGLEIHSAATSKSAVADFDHFKMYVAAALDRLERT
jgi:hypothetical protein